MGAEPHKTGENVVPFDARTAEPTTRWVVGGTHLFILKVSRVFGLAPLRFERCASGGCVVAESRLMCLYSYVLVTALIACTVGGHWCEVGAGPASVRMGSRMAQAVSSCDVLVVAATAAAGVYAAPRRMRAMLLYMDSLASFDNVIGAQYSDAKERRVCAALMLALAFFTLLIVDDFFYYAVQARSLDRHWDVTRNYLGFYVLWYMAMILEIQFAFTALTVRARLRAVNDAVTLTAAHLSIRLSVEKTKEQMLLNMFAVRLVSPPPPPPPPPRANNVCVPIQSEPHSDDTTTIIVRGAGLCARLAVPPCEAVRRLAALHGELCAAVRRIDDSYGLPLIVILVSTLLHLIVTPYFLIVELIVSSNRIHFLVLQFLWCGVHVLRMFVLVEPCHYTVLESKRTEDLVCILLSRAPEAGALLSRLETFSRQLLHRSLRYSPLGLCTLDRPLVATVLGAVTTYLVILLQFQRFEV